MSLFGRRKRAVHEAKKEAEIQAVRRETFKQIDKRVQRLDDTNQKMDELLDDKNFGVSGNIFLATGGDHRIQRIKK